MTPSLDRAQIDAYTSDAMAPSRCDPVSTLAARVKLECAGGGLRRASRAISRFYEAAFAPLDLTATQFSLLVAVQLGGPIPLSRLADALVLDRTSLYRAVKPLVRRRYLRILPGQTRRERTAALTEGGCRLLAEALPIWERVQGRFVGALGPGPGRRSRRDCRRSCRPCRRSSPAPRGRGPIPLDTGLHSPDESPRAGGASHMMHMHRSAGRSLDPFDCREPGRCAVVVVSRLNPVRFNGGDIPSMAGVEEKHMADQKRKAEQFRALHIPGEPFVLFNIWDVGSAKAVAASGAKAIATVAGRSPMQTASPMARAFRSRWRSTICVGSLPRPTYR